MFVYESEVPVADTLPLTDPAVTVPENDEKELVSDASAATEVPKIIAINVSIFVFIVISFLRNNDNFSESSENNKLNLCLGFLPTKRANPILLVAFWRVPFEA